MRFRVTILHAISRFVLLDRPKHYFKLEAKYVLPTINHTQAAEGAEKCQTPFCPWWPWPLTFNFDLQTRPSEGPNTSSLWIWCKSVQWFSRYFTYKERSHRQRRKQNLTQFTVSGEKVLPFAVEVKLVLFGVVSLWNSFLGEAVLA